jgi:hypothetical protein
LGNQKAEVLSGSAKVARRGAGDISAAKGLLLDSVDDAQAAGFTVGEDYSTTDTQTGGTASDRSQRQAQAQEFSDDMREKAKQLVQTEHAVAANLATAAAGLGDTHFNESPIHSPDDTIIGAPKHPVRPVDHTFKNDQPTPPPSPGPDLGSLQKQIQDQQRQLDEQMKGLHDQQQELNQIKDQQAQQGQPSEGGLVGSFLVGCGLGAAATSETGPGALGGCVLGGAGGDLTYILSKIWG